MRFDCFLLLPLPLSSKPARSMQDQSALFVSSSGVLSVVVPSLPFGFLLRVAVSVTPVSSTRCGPFGHNHQNQHWASLSPSRIVSLSSPWCPCQSVSQEHMSWDAPAFYKTWMSMIVYSQSMAGRNLLTRLSFASPCRPLYLADPLSCRCQSSHHHSDWITHEPVIFRRSLCDVSPSDHCQSYPGSGA